MPHKKLIHFDQLKCDRQIDTYNHFISVFTERIEEFKALNIGDLANNEEFKALLIKPREFLQGKVMDGRSLEVNGMSFSRHALFGMLKKPVGYHNLIFKIEELHKIIKQNEKENMEHFLDYFVYDSEKINFRPGLAAEIERRCKVWVESGFGVQLFELLEKFEKLLNHEIVTACSMHARQGVYNQLFNRYFDFNPDTKKYSINIEQVKMAETRGRVTI